MGKFHHFHQQGGSHDHGHEKKHGCGHQCQKGCGQSCGKCRCYSKLRPLSLGVAGGFVGGVGTLFLGWSAAFGNWGIPMVDTLGSVYLGFKPTFAGAMTGAAWGFVDGFLSGLLFGYAYNILLCCYFHCSSCSKSRCNTDHATHEGHHSEGDTH